MISGELKSKVDAVWNAFWSGGVANPLTVIEQITYLIFLRRLDQIETNAEAKAKRTGRPMERHIFGNGETPTGVPFSDLRWNTLKNTDPQSMYRLVSEHVFPFLRGLATDGTAYGQQMKDATFMIPTPALLAKVVDLLDTIDLNNRDTNGDLYEYLLSELASAGKNGQFRTPRHIIALMVALMKPTPSDVIVDPASGTSGFLVGAGEYLREHHKADLADPKVLKHFSSGMFHGFDSDATMLRIGSMNMLMHGVENPDIRRQDSLAEEHTGDLAEYSLVLANPPFAGSLDHDTVAKDLLAVVKTKKTELLFLALFIRLLKTGGRAAVIVPDGVLFGSTKAHKELRRILVEDQKLDAVVKLPSGVFKPYAGVSTAILIFTKTQSGGTDHVWFYDITADGFSLDDKRTPTEANDLPDVLARWSERDGKERDRPRTAQSFCVPRADIVAQGYDLSLNRYKEIEYEEVEHRPPLEIIADLKTLEAEIAQGLDELEEMLR